MPTGHGPRGWLEKGPSASLFVRYVSHRICSSLTPRIQTLLKPTVCLLLMTRCTRLDCSRSLYVVSAFNTDTTRTRDGGLILQGRCWQRPGSRKRLPSLYLLNICRDAYFAVW